MKYVMNAHDAAILYGRLDELLDSIQRQIELNIGDPDTLFIDAERYNPITIHEVIKMYRDAGWHLDEILSSDDEHRLIGFVFE